MDKSVKRVTVIEGSGENRQAKVVYEDQKDVDESEIPPIERAVRHVVNAALISAQVAYDTYLRRAVEGKTDWVFQPRGRRAQTPSQPARNVASDQSTGTEHGQSGSRID
jgi:hypothetical protein